jgi:PadR family transcriptional regulator PadR
MHTFASRKEINRRLHLKQRRMNVENTKAQMRKGMLEYCIMLLLRNRSCYANDIISQLKDADMIVVEGTLYPLLNRLLKDKILKYEWQESTQGPPRKYYSLTMDGEEALNQLNQSWNELAGTVNKLKTEN